jgi:hypothetical protein
MSVKVASMTSATVTALELRSGICQATTVNHEDTKGTKVLFRVLRGFVKKEVVCPDQARAGAFASAFACFASVANATGLEMASSDRLLRSSFTPACFNPLMNWP